MPSSFVLHTVGPIIKPGQSERPDELASCYSQCLNVLKSNGIRSIAFCCISTGVYNYPQESAAKVALSTVKKWLDHPDNQNCIDLVVFNCFLEKDFLIYKSLIPKYFQEEH